MGKKSNRQGPPAPLEPEKKLSREKEKPGSPQARDRESLIHELETHQTELQMQNEELRNAREELEQSHRLYVDLFDFAPIGYFVLDRNGIIQSANFTGAHMIGSDKYGIISLPFSAFIVREDWEIFYRHLKEVFARQVKQLDEVRMIGANNSLLSVRLQSIIAEERKQQPFTCRTAIIDITALKEADKALRAGEKRYRDLAEELREADRHKNEFIAVLSHELRNPLAAINNGLSILERTSAGDKRDDERARRARDIINRQFAHLTRIIDDLLDVTRITQQKINLQKRVLEINELVRRTVEDHRPMFEQKGIRLTARYLAVPLYVNADEIRLTQVIWNLLQNALKFTDRDGQVQVMLEPDSSGRQVVIQVTDNGTGIAKDMLPHLFKPFIQADTTLNRSKGGLGLGLSLVKGLVELHNGTVVAASAGLGKGAQFIITLPLADQPANATQPECAALPRSGRKVLVIDDNADFAENLRELLELDGFVVSLAYDGREGLCKLKEFQPEVVLCDIGLPVMDGYEVARTIRQEPSAKNIFLIALTGYVLPEDLERSGRAGFDRHLAKPVDIAALERLLADRAKK